MNATGTNPDRRAEKAQHHHSALVPSEYAAGCFSLSRALRGSSETQDRARLASLQDPHRTAPDAVSNIWRFRPPNPRRTGAAHWATSLLACHVPLSPTVKGPVCVGSTQPPRPQGEQKGPQAVPRKTQPGLRTIAELGETTVPSGSSYPASRPWCGPEPQAARPRARGQRSCGDGRAGSTAPPCSARSARDSGTADGDTRPLPAETGKLDNVAPGHRPGHVHSHSRAIAQAVPTGRGNIPTALRLLETRPVLAMQAYSFKSSEQDASRPETEARRRGPGAPGNASYKHGLGRAGQAPEPRAGVPRRGNESPKR